MEALMVSLSTQCGFDCVDGRYPMGTFHLTPLVTSTDEDFYIAQATQRFARESSRNSKAVQKKE
ncbi:MULTISPECIES: hypothetical protein [Serratia]|uniref:hypothetical protein n=1 Tax=Serratia TaxID=613 RepID=UPI00080F8E2E|nr:MULTISPECIES: hypothetical protein [Serratia]OCJ37345.1 hypothetical protein A6U95_24860 [Serratia sp. 14-2641]QXN65248.1 hypothetical protein J8M99_26160 [Serratia fonticola]